MTTTLTACSLDCPDGCSVLIKTSRDGKLSSLRGNPEHPFTQGFTCAKIRRIAKRLNHPERILHPLRRQGGKFLRVSWDEALSECAERISVLRSDPRGMLHIQGSGAQGLLKRACRSFFARLGASGTQGSLCNAAGAEACRTDFGALDLGDPADILKSSSIINWGRDLSRSSIHLGRLVAKARKAGVRVVSVGTGAEDNGPFSSRLVRVRPGTDRFLAAAVAKLLWEQGGMDPDAPEFCANLGVFLELLKTRSLTSLLDECGATCDDAATLAACYGRRPTATLIGWGLQRYRLGGESVRFINALAAVSGSMGVAGGGSFYSASPMRHFDLGLLAEPPETAELAGLSARAGPGGQRRLLDKAALGGELARADPPVEFAWINGTNIVNQCADSLGVARALEKIPFTVCVEAFPTDTARRCDLILPCSLVFETEDIVASFLHHCVNLAQPAFAPPGEARDDYSILRDLGSRLDPPLTLPHPERFMEAALARSGVDLEDLRRKGFADLTPARPPFEGPRFARPDGKCLLPEELHAETPSPEGYPLRLLSLIRREAIHSQIPPEDHSSLPSLRVGPGCPLPPGTGFGREAWLVSPLGRMKVRIDLDEGLAPDLAVYRRGDWMALGGGVNRLVPEVLSDMGRTAAYYECRVRLEPVACRGL